MKGRGQVLAWVSIGLLAGCPPGAEQPPASDPGAQSIPRPVEDAAGDDTETDAAPDRAVIEAIRAHVEKLRADRRAETLSRIDKLGGRVVGDDLCTGSRYFDTAVDELAEPFAALTERYLQRAPCPVKHGASQPRTQRLLRLCHDTDAQGVIFMLPKFCEPHAFDYVPLAHALQGADVPHLLIETDVSIPMGQLRTRLQAFIEMLEQPSG